MAYFLVANAKKEVNGTHATLLRRRAQIVLESISRLARQAQDKGGLSGVSLADLRRDFNIRQLQEHGWPYADRVSGVAPATLYAKSAPYMTAAKAPSTEEQPVDESFMWRVLQSEGSSLVGLALWMTWKLGLRAGELLALTWDQVDLEKNELRLPDQRVSLGTTARRMLLDVRQQNKDDEDPHVLLTPNSRKPFDRAWLSKKRPHDPGPGRHGGHHSAGRGRGVPP